MKATLRLAFLCALFSTTAIARADWTYRVDTDAMTDKKSEFASIRSTNTLALGFPYTGENQGMITVRRMPRSGVDVLVHVEKGQMICHHFDGNCAALVRFDAAPPRRFAAVGSSDGDSRYIFLRDARGFIASASKAKRVLVQVEFFQNGLQTLEFSSAAPLKWDAVAPHKNAGAK